MYIDRNTNPNNRPNYTSFSQIIRYKKYYANRHKKYSDTPGLIEKI